MVKSKAVFLDRDGVLNIPKIYKKKSYAPLKYKHFKLYPSVKKFCQILKKKISNHYCYQSTRCKKGYVKNF